MLSPKPHHGHPWMPLVVLVALLGCGQPVGTAPKSAAVDNAAAKGPVQQPEVRVTVTDGAGFRDVLKRHVGKVVLVDFWASW